MRHLWTTVCLFALSHCNGCTTLRPTDPGKVCKANAEIHFLAHVRKCDTVECVNELKAIRKADRQACK